MAETHPDTVIVALQQIERFRLRALASDKEEERRRIVDAADCVIKDLQDVGLLGTEAADILAKDWVDNYLGGRSTLVLQ